MDKLISIKFILVLPFLFLNSSCNSESKKDVEQDLAATVTDRISPNIFTIIFKSRQEKTDKTDLPKNLPSDISHFIISIILIWNIIYQKINRPMTL